MKMYCIIFDRLQYKNEVIAIKFEEPSTSHHDASLQV